MSSYIRLQNFIAAGQRAYGTSQVQHLMSQGNQAVSVSDISRSLNSRTYQEQNRQAWDVFLRSMNDVIGAHRVEEICRRYRFNPQNMERQGLPLLPQHIEMFSIGASRVMTRDIKESENGTTIKLRNVAVEQLPQRLRAANPFPVMGEILDPQLITGAPTTLRGHFIHDPLLMDKEAQALLSDAHTLSPFAWRERFCKSLIGKELVEKQIIPAPGAHGRAEYYKVYRKITTGDGLVAYALTPLGQGSSLKPILFFRPTQFAVSAEDAVASYMNDVQPELGKMGYEATKSSLDQLMIDPKFWTPGQTIEVAGYSLGGTHSQRFVADNWRKVSDVMFFNDPSVESELAERFAQDVNAHAGELAHPLRLTIVRTAGDLATCVGEKHVGWGITHQNVTVKLINIDHQNNPLSFLDLHGARVFDGPYTDYQTTSSTDPAELRTQLDNEARGPLVFGYENLRKFWGGVVYVILFIFREMLHIFSDISGVEILRSSIRSRT